MNKKMLKIIKIALVCFAIFILIGTLIVSRDEHHLETCHEECCIYCSLITIIAIIAIVFGVFLYSFLSKLRQNQLIFILNSLVFRKVQLNE